MKEAKYSADCAVINGKLVVCSGLNKSDGHCAKVIKPKSVESYHQECVDCSSVPNMNGEKAYHSMFFAKNRMFVIGVRRNKSEVFDNNSSKFIFLDHSKYQA